MKRSLMFVLSVLALGLACACNVRAKEVTDLAEAAANPDFAVQGEYVGADAAGKLGAQVISLSGGKFTCVVFTGGLPGDGWKRGDKSFKMEGTAGKLQGNDMTASIADGKLVILSADGKPAGELKKTERKSSTLGEKAPEGAVVLFDGSSAEKFDLANHLTADKNLLSGVTTKDKFGSYKLHIEFRLSWMPEARGQGRSNSGVYVHDCYEIQVLDSFGLEGANNECGGFYSVKAPDVNMCFPPMTWQTYDVDFTAPKYENGKKVANARMTVLHNGVVIHKDLEFKNGTPGRDKEGPAPRVLHLQGHGNKVYYRNIWLLEKKD